MKKGNHQCLVRRLLLGFMVLFERIFQIFRRNDNFIRMNLLIRAVR